MGFPFGCLFTEDKKQRNSMNRNLTLESVRARLRKCENTEFA